MAAPGWVIYRCTSSERGRQRGSMSERAKEEKDRERDSKVKGEEGADWTSKPPDPLSGSLSRAQFDRQLKLAAANASDIFFLYGHIIDIKPAHTNYRCHI